MSDDPQAPPPAPTAQPPAAKPDPAGPPAKLWEVRVGKADGAEFKGDDRFTPTAREARSLIMDLNLVEGGLQPTKDQMDLYAAIARVADVLDHLYPASRRDMEARFRPYFVALFHFARLALEGDPQAKGKVGARLELDLAKSELQRIEKALIDDEEGRVKNAHLAQLGQSALQLSAPLALAYVVLSASEPGGVVHKAAALLNAHPDVVARYCLLWIGCFVGVVLSYAYRKPRLALEDLVVVESDRLSVPSRLLLAGASTMLLVMLCAFGLFDIGIGSSLKLSALSDAASPDGITMFSFVVGIVCGIGELALAGTLSGKLKGVLPGAGK